MPESAEVRRLAGDIGGVIGQMVAATRVASGRYMRSPIPGFDKLAGYRLMNIGVKGKLLILNFKPNSDIGVEVNILSTLGMTGWWHYSDGELFLPQKENAFNPKHVRLRIDFEDRSIVFTDPRNFGTLKVTTNAGVRKKLQEMGPDIARHDLIPAEFWLRFEKYAKNRPIAEVMLDQRVFCGVGNYMRADGMYLAGIDPRVPAKELSKRHLGQLWTDTHLVANAAFHDKAVGSPTKYFYNVCYGRTHDDHDNPIESYQDSNGRTVWWCPARQAL